MRTVPLLGAIVFIGAAVISGCGQQHAGGQSGGSTSGGSTSGGSTSGGAPSGGSLGASGSGGGEAAACHSGSPSRARSLTLTATDNYKTFCVAKGAKISVFLKGTPARKWSPIHASSSVLKPAANGELALALGVTGASFLAAEPGTATITSARPVCGKGVPPANSTPGAMGCDASLAFRAIVRVAS